jgi:hypothetical protein
MCVKKILFKALFFYHLCLILFLTVGIFINSAQANNAAFTIIKSDAESIDLHVDTPPINFDKVVMGGKDWDSLEIPEYYTTVKPGAPQLPVIAAFVSIPWGMNAEIQAVKTGNAKTTEGYKVCPNEAPGDKFAFDTDIYSSDSLYPGNVAELSSPSGFRDYWVVRIMIYPVQYNPQRTELQIYDSVDVSIRYVKDEKLANEPRKAPGPVPPVFEYLYKHHIINSESASLITTGSVLNLLVITPQQFSSAVMPLINYYLSINPNFQYRIVTIESIGNDNPINIRNKIKDYYLNYNLYDVLLVGDSDGSYGSRLPAFRTDLPGQFWCGDYLYAALNGDSSIVYTHPYPFSIDGTRDVKIGRLSGTSAAEITMLVNKILTYRTNPPSGNWPTKHLFVAHKYDPNTGDYKAVKNAIVAGSGSWQSSPQFTLCYGDYLSGTNENVKWAINTNHEGTVNYCGHGTFSRWPYWNVNNPNESFAIEDVNSLFNGNYTPVVFNVCCQSGIFFGGITCLSEAWVRKSPGGAVGALGAVSDTLLPQNSIFDQKLYKYIFQYRWNIGDAHLAAIMDSGNYVCNAFTWFGDPLMDIRSLPISAAPSAMTASSEL